MDKIHFLLFIFFITGFFSVLHAQSSIDGIKIPLKKDLNINSPGPEYGLVRDMDIHQYVKPKSLDTTQLIVKLLDVQPKQSLYQNYLQGRITKENMYGRLALYGDTGTTNFYRGFLNTTTAVLIYDSATTRKFIVDKNNNRSFVDDTVYSINVNLLSQNPENLRNAILFTARAQYFYQGRIYEVENNCFLQPYSRTIKYDSRLENKLFCSVSMVKNSYSASINSKIVRIENNLLMNLFDPSMSKISISDSSGGGTTLELGDSIRIEEHIIILDSVAKDFSELFIKKIPSTGHEKGYSEGSVAYNFHFPIKNGKNSTLHSQRGKYVLLDFWGTWCAPCIGAIPKLKKIEREISRNALMIVGIAVEHTTDSAAFKKFIKKYDLSWPTLFQPTVGTLLSGLVSVKYKIEHYPTYILINPSGRIILRGAAEETLEKIEIFLKRNIP